MEIRIMNCLKCAIEGELTGRLKDEKANVVEITSREICYKCGKEIRIHGVKVEMDKKSFGEIGFSLTWY